MNDHILIIWINCCPVWGNGSVFI